MSELQESLERFFSVLKGTKMKMNNLPTFHLSEGDASFGNGKSLIDTVI